MRKLFLLLLLALPCWAGDIYVSQSGAGTVFTTSCAVGTRSSAWFNSNATGGNTYHLCGTFTGAANAGPMLTVPADGTLGSPLIVFAEPNALFTAPYWQGNFIDSGELHGAIVSSHNYVILDGGTNGTIQNTANGDGLANQQPSWGMTVGGSNVIVRNWTIQNIYVAQNALASSLAVRTADMIVNFGSTNVTVCNNLLSYAYGSLIYYGVGASSTQVNDCQSNTFGTGNNIFLNTFQNSPWNINFSPEAASSPNIYANRFELAGPWGIRVQGCDGNDAHSDGIIVYNQGASVIANPYIYNNDFIGDLGGACPTSHIYCTYGFGAGGGSSCNIFNNVMVNTGSTTALEGSVILGQGAGQVVGPHKIYNNTSVNHTTTHWVANGVQGAGNDKYWNEIISTNFSQTGTFFYGYNASAPYSLLSTDYIDYYDSATGGAAGWWVMNTTYNSLAAWKTGCTGGGGSPCDAHSVYGNPLLDGSYHLGTGSPAIGVAANLTSSCTGQMAPLCSDKPPTVGKGGSLSGSVARPPSGAWDAGAYQYSGTAAQPICSPGSGIYTVTQTVSCSDSSAGAIMCFTIDGTTPVTNGASGCTTGTLYTSSISVASSETLNIIAGGSAWPDGPVASYSYTINSGSGPGQPVGEPAHSSAVTILLN